MLCAVVAASPWHDQPTANEHLGEYAADDDDQIQQPGDSGLETRRRFCNPFHY